MLPTQQPNGPANRSLGQFRPRGSAAHTARGTSRRAVQPSRRRIPPTHTTANQRKACTKAHIYDTQRAGYIGAPTRKLSRFVPNNQETTPDTMGEGFVAATAGFMANWGPKVTQLAPLTSLDLKPEPMTMTDPSRHPGHRSAHPGAAQSVSNTSTAEQAF
jgi:hypothetical protein